MFDPVRSRGCGRHTDDPEHPSQHNNSDPASAVVQRPPSWCIKNVREVDRGWYMGEHDPMRARDICGVPPVIIDNMTSTDMVVREGHQRDPDLPRHRLPQAVRDVARGDGQDFNWNGESANGCVNAARPPRAPALAIAAAGRPTLIRGCVRIDSTVAVTA
ncbi:hypothetical protein EVAR_60999_1 [Eumeta japonica]|uniref:Uncharacterized protein n=1 Tax=Eumeta variegata TaxID=151549 RepID=A0A4C1ZRU9_EUMVA|nr:hypothetical protein EVAR_60999_1 [Eumeta japonica]